jgi:hypothetical protein
MRIAWLGRVVSAVCGIGLAACGCRHSAEAIPEATPLPATTTAPASSSGSESAPGAAVEPPLTAESLHGSWMEYWALAGHADTQRFTFMPDGRFGWCAAPDSGAGAGAAAPGGDAVPARRWGRYSLAGQELVLSVQGEDITSDCDGKGPCRSTHVPALEQRLPLGACPPNDEARALDAHYRCISVGGQAFWLRDGQGKSDVAAAALAK